MVIEQLNPIIDLLNLIIAVGAGGCMFWIGLAIVRDGITKRSKKAVMVLILILMLTVVVNGIANMGAA